MVLVGHMVTWLPVSIAAYGDEVTDHAVRPNDGSTGSLNWDDVGTMPLQSAAHK